MCSLVVWGRCQWVECLDFLLDLMIVLVTKGMLLQGKGNKDENSVVCSVEMHTAKMMESKIGNQQAYDVDYCTGGSRFVAEKEAQQKISWHCLLIEIPRIQGQVLTKLPSLDGKP